MGGTVRAAVTRRSFMRQALTTSLFLTALQLVDSLTTRTQAVAANTCSTSGLTYNSTCPQGYGTSCSQGCATLPSSTYYCLSTSWKARHRTCGERKAGPDGNYWDFAIRTNECWPGSTNDGWEWWGVDGGSKCGCTNQPGFSCNDGYYRLESPSGTALSGYSTSVCQTFKCI